MKDVTEVKKEIIDGRIERIVEDATKILDNPYASPECVAAMMRRLFASPCYGNEMIQAYNKLEKKWKILVSYRTNETHVI